MSQTLWSSRCTLLYWPTVSLISDPGRSWKSLGLTHRARSCLHDWSLLSVHVTNILLSSPGMWNIRVSCTFRFRYPISCTNKRQGLICFSCDLLFLWLQEQRASCVVSGISPLQRCLPPVHMNFCFWRQTCKLTVESNPEEGGRETYAVS